MWFALASADGAESSREESFLLLVNEVHKLLKGIPQKQDLFEMVYSENGFGAGWLEKWNNKKGILSFQRYHSAVSKFPCLSPLKYSS